VDIRETLKLQSTAKEIHTHQKNWKDYITSMQDKRLPKSAFKYKPVGK
jgi:hypothetical protein